MKILMHSLFLISLLLLAACAPIKHTVTNEDPYTITRTTFLGIPVAETRKWSQDPVPADSNDRMKKMEDEMRKANDSIHQPSPSMIKP